MELPTHLKELFQEIIHWPYLCPTLIALLIILLIWRKINKRNKIISLSTHQEGKVCVVRTALIDLIENTCNDIIPNSKPRVCLCEKGGKLNLKIKIRVFSNQNIEQTTSIIQKQISHILQSTLGLENIGTINILIAGFRKTPIQQALDDNSDYPKN